MNANSFDLLNETMHEVCEVHNCSDPDEMGYVTCSKCDYCFNIHDDNYDEDEDENMDIACPICYLEYDSIDYEYQMCHYCNRE